MLGGDGKKSFGPLNYKLMEQVMGKYMGETNTELTPYRSNAVPVLYEEPKPINFGPIIRTTKCVGVIVPWLLPMALTPFIGLGNAIGSTVMYLVCALLPILLLSITNHIEIGHNTPKMRTALQISWWPVICMLVLWRYIRNDE